MTKTEVRLSYDVRFLTSVAQGLGNRSDYQSPEDRSAAARRLLELGFADADNILFELLFDPDEAAAREVRRWQLEGWLRKQAWTEQLMWARQLERRLFEGGVTASRALRAFPVFGIPMPAAMSWIEARSFDDSWDPEDTFLGLRVLSRLGSTGKRRLSSRWRKVVARYGPSPAAQYAAESVLHPNDLSFYLSNWPTDVDPSYSVYVLKSLARRYPQSANRVIEALQVGLKDSSVWPGSLIDSLDSPVLVYLTLDGIWQNRSVASELSRNTRALANSLKRIRLPRQVQALQDLSSDYKVDILAALQFSLTSSSGIPPGLRFDTVESDHKRAAWNIACDCGLHEVRGLLAPAIESEPSSFLAASLAKTAALVSASDAIKPISEHLRRSEDNLGLALALIESLEVFASREALESLLQYRTISDSDDYPQALSDAVVSCLYHSGGEELVWETYLSTKDTFFQRALAYILEDAAGLDLGKVLLPRVIAHLKDHPQSPGASELLRAVVSWSEEDLAPDVAALLKDFGESRSLSLAVALILSGQSRSRPDIFRPYGLRCTKEGWTFEGPELPWTDYLIRLICNHDNSQQNLIAEYVEYHLAQSPRSWPAQLLYGLSLEKWQASTVSAIERVAFSYNGPHTTNLLPFKVLADAAPERLVQASFWHSAESSVSLDCLAFLIKAVPQRLYPELTKIEAWRRLADVAPDEIRKEVLKVLVTQEGPKAIVSRFYLAVSTGDIATCVVLLESGHSLLAGKNWREVSSLAKRHQHPVVRKAEREFQGRIYNRTLSTRYFGRLLLDLEIDVLRCFSLSNAIIALADDDTLKSIQAELRQPAEKGRNSRHAFLIELESRLSKAIKKRDENWKKVLQTPQAPEEREAVKAWLQPVDSDLNSDLIPVFPGEGLEMEIVFQPGERSWHSQLLIGTKASQPFNEVLTVDVRLEGAENRRYTASGTVFWLPNGVESDEGRTAISVHHLRRTK